MFKKNAFFLNDKVLENVLLSTTTRARVMNFKNMDKK